MRLPPVLRILRMRLIAKQAVGICIAAALLFSEFCIAPSTIFSGRATIDNTGSDTCRVLIGSQTPADQSRLSPAQADMTGGDIALSSSSPSRPETPPRVSNQPTTALEHLYGRKTYDSFGVDHFKNKLTQATAEPLQQRALNFVERVFDQLPNRDAIATWQELLAESDKLFHDLDEHDPTLRADPLLVACHGIVAGNCGDEPLARLKLTQAIEQFKNQNYPARTVVFCHHRRFYFQPSNTPDAELRQPLIEYRDALISWLERDFEATEQEYRYVVENIRYFLAQCRIHRTLDLVDQFHVSFVQQSHLPKWIRYMTRGYCCLIAGMENYEWKEQKFLSKTGQSSDPNLDKAIGFFQQAHQGNPMFPEAATEMIRLSQYRPFDDEKMRKWFQEAKQGQVDFMPLYRLRLGLLLPSHGGSVPKMLDFARTTVADADFDTMVPEVLLTCYWMLTDQVEVEDADRTEALQDPKLKQELLAIIEGFLTNNRVNVADGSIVAPAYFNTIKAVWAIQGGDMAAADVAIQELNNHYDQAALKQLKTNATTFDVFRCQAYALTSEYESEATQLIELWGDTREARLASSRKIRELTEQVLAENQNSISSLFFKQAGEQVALEERYTNGREIVLTFDPELSMWKSRDIQQIQFESEKSAIINNLIGDSEFSLSSIVHTPGSKTIRLEIEFLTDSQGNRNTNGPTASVIAGDYFKRSMHIGVSEGKLPLDETSPTTSSLGKLRFGETHPDAPEFFYDVELQAGKNQLEVKVCEHYFEVFLNDRFIFRSQSNCLHRGSDFFQLVQPPSQMGRGKMRVSNIRLKPWRSVHPFFEVTPEELVAYYRGEQARDSKDKWLNLWLGESYHMTGKFELAIEQYELAIKQGLNPAVAGFYIGDAHERLGDIPEAIQWYRLGAKKETQDLTRLYGRTHRDSYSNPQHWAAFRLAWLAVTTPVSKENPIPFNSLDYASPLAPEHIAWLDDLLAAQQLAIKGDFSAASALARRTLPNCNSKSEAKVIEMIQAFESKKCFYEPENSAPIYQMVDKPIPFLRHFEDHLLLDEAKNY